MKRSMRYLEVSFVVLMILVNLGGCASNGHREWFRPMSTAGCRKNKRQR